MTPKFKIGDKVTVALQDRCSDMEADLWSAFRDGDITGKDFDVLKAAIVDGKPLTICEVYNDNTDGAHYGVRVGKINFVGLVPESDLIPAKK